MRRADFNDNWRCNGQPVTLPHDAMLHEERNPHAACGSAGAFFPGNSYIYEKKFLRPAAQHVLLQFEGVYRNARVFLNGREAGGADYGYIPFWVNADPYLVPGENTIRVECDAKDQPDSRWYSGAGIYRPVWLWEGPENAIAPESVRLRTISIHPAVIRIQSPAKIRAEIGGVGGEGTDFTLELPEAKLWSAEHPHLYRVRLSNGADTAEIPFGIRRIEWSGEGLLVNGEETLLRGGCLHHDNGILGAAAYDESELRKVRLMKEAGFNAIRSAHNPASRGLLDACDQLGMYVIDEGWDMWYYHKTKYDYAAKWQENHLSDLQAMAARDYNHPSVIMYSIGNEVSEPAQAKGVAAAREMTEYLHREDPGRAVTGGFNLMIISRSAKGKGVYDENGGGRDDSGDKKVAGMNSTMFNMLTNMVGTGMNKAANGGRADRLTAPVLDTVDIAGYNYASGRYPKEGKAHPGRVIYGSETFPQDIARNWEMVKKYPYLVGDFLWTAIDYLGEAGLGAWAYTQDGKAFNKPYPWLLADTGVMDILGNPNGEYYQAKAVWGLLDAPAICVQPLNHPGVKPAKAVWRGTNSIPSWSWAGCEGSQAVVEVYTDAEAVELRLNGRKIGRKKTKACRAVFRVPYEPGTLTAETGRRTASLISAGNAGVVACADRQEADPGEILYIPVLIADEKGIVESNADRKVSVTVAGGELLGLGSANPRTEERFDAGAYTTYYGRALAVVRAGKNGVMQLTASDGNSTARAAVRIKGDVS